MTESNTAAVAVSARHGVLHLSHPEAHIPGYEYPVTASPPPARWQLLVGGVVAVALAIFGFWCEHKSHGVEDSIVALPWVAPFVLLLASIAAMPFIAKHWWEHNYARVAIALGAIVIAYYLFFVDRGPLNVARAAAEYISFIFLLGSLFIVSGGILIRVRARSTPMANTVLLLIGAVIANIFGTTGASMLLIRPFLRMNKAHLRPYHVVFFIFVVSNTGGSLTPIGDPPLFLGYLKGVPFFWVFEHCWPIWVMVNVVLVVLFYAIDTYYSKKGDRRGEYDGTDFGPSISFYGGTNLLFITLIIVGILGHGPLNSWTHEHLGFEGPWRELLMVVAAFGSLLTTPTRVHGENYFNYAPIKEVAFLFVGIFATMLPALNYLYHASAGGSSAISLHTAGQYYFSVGSLSAALDNAPTYLTFLKTELGSLDKDLVDRAEVIVKRDNSWVMGSDVVGLTDEQNAQLHNTINALHRYHADAITAGTLGQEELRVGFLVGDPKLNLYLIAISMGAVLFGAMTYIGNGPNFMVKSIAEHSNAPTPSFFGYMFRYSIPILLPILILVWAVFLL